MGNNNNETSVGGMIFTAGLFALAGVGATHVVKTIYKEYDRHRTMRCMEKLGTILEHATNVMEKVKVEEPKQEEVSEEA